MPRIPGLLERIQQPLYDTVIIQPTETHWTFFQNSLPSRNKLSVLDASSSIHFQPELKCSLCKDDIFGCNSPTPGFLSTLHNCSGCSTIYHKSCMREMSGCAVIGCSFEGLPIDTKKADPKTLVDTNMEQAGSLPYPKNFEIHTISLHFDKTVDKYDIDSFKEYSSYKLFIGTKTYLDLPVSVIDDLQGSGRNMGYVLAEPIDLLPQQNFYASITYEGDKKSDVTFRVRNVLQGFFKREVH